MEFLVRLDINLPPEMDPAVRADLQSREREHGAELRRKGAIVRMWRIPGEYAAIGIWEAADATELHEHLSGLPLYPWMKGHVTALARHHADPILTDI